MLSTPHVAVGAALAVGVGSPVLAIPLAIGSHFLLDMTPHWNPHLNTDLRKYGHVSPKNTLIVVVDTLVALVLGFYVAYSTVGVQTGSILILASCFTSILPDLVEAPHYFLGHKSKSVDRYIKWQKSIQNDVAVLPGLAVQLTVIIVALWTIFG